MKNAESLKAKIKNIAKKNKLDHLELLQMYLFECFLEKLEKSNFRKHFIVKGGLLISSIIGVDHRTTMDMDATIKSFPLNELTVKEVLSNILTVETDSGVSFSFDRMEQIRENDQYQNFRVHLIATYEKIQSPLCIDMTTGDEITPHEIEYTYKGIFKDKNICVLAYPLTTLFAEKIETILSRNIHTSRMKDFYDIYCLYQLKKEEIDYINLNLAIEKTAKRRDSYQDFIQYSEICEEMRSSNYLLQLWTRYQSTHQYSRDIHYIDTIDVIEKLLDNCKFEKQVEAELEKDYEDEFVL